MEALLKNLDNEQVHRLFPFHIILGNDLTIISAGNSLQKVIPNLIGGKISDFFNLKRDHLSLTDFDDIKKRKNDLFIMQSSVNEKLVLRGQFEYIDQSGQMLFLGSPWFRSVQEMNEIGLNLHDFAAHDFLQDMMMVVMTLQNANEDVRKFADQLQVQKNELRRISSIVENYPHPVVICGPDLNINWVNEAFVQFNGYTLAEVKGELPAKYLYASHSDEYAVHEIDRKYRLGENVNQQLINMDKSGAGSWISLYGQCMRDNKGNRIQYFFVQQNITKQVEAEMNIKNALQKEIILGDLKSRFVEMASHEFRTPMTAIKLQAELIGMQLDRQNVAEDDKIRKKLGTIDKEIDRLTRLINDILLLGKIEQSEIKIDKKKMDLVKMIRSEIDRQNDLNLMSDPVTMIIEGNQRLVEIDEIKILHIIENLLSNAIKYSANCKAPYLNIKFLSYHFEVNVKDHGIGIPYPEQSRIMDTFFRASNAVNYKGTGIGMSIVKNLVEMHNGHIRFASIPGEGSEFIVSIPY